MPWNAVNPSNIKAAMDECDEISLDAFRIKYSKFQPAKNRHMVLNGRKGRYEARPLLAGAYANLNPHGPNMGPANFMGINAQTFLIKRGFQAVRIGEQPGN